MNPRQRRHLTDRLLARMETARPGTFAEGIAQAFTGKQLDRALGELAFELTPSNVSVALMFVRQLERSLMALQRRMPQGQGHF